MTRIFQTILIGTALSLGLSACGGEPTAEEKIEAAQKIEANADAKLAEMDIIEIADYMGDQGRELTEVLRGVTDKASAEAALPAIREIVPKVRAAGEAMSNMDESKITMNLKLMKKLPEVAQVQMGLVSEMMRVGQIPEAREVLETELEDIEF